MKKHSSPDPEHRSVDDSTQSKANQGDRPEGFDVLFDSGFYASQMKESETREPLEHYLNTSCYSGLPTHPLFSACWYLRQRGTMEAGDPIADYLLYGAKLGMDPHPLFSSDHYCKQAAIDPTADNPLLHYLLGGWRNGFTTHPWLDNEYLIRQIPRRLSGQVPAIVYWLETECNSEIRLHPLFHPGRLAIVLRREGRTVNRLELCKAFVTWDEPFSPSPLFDIDFYCSQIRELDRDRAWEHFMNEGQYLPVDPNPYFDSAFYSERYERYISSHQSPFMHYMINESSGRFDPSPKFKLRYYRKRTSKRGETHRSSLEGFLEVGRFRSAETEPFAVPSYVLKHAKQAFQLDSAVVKRPRKLAQFPVYNRHMSSSVATLYDMIKSTVRDSVESIILVSKAPTPEDRSLSNLVGCLAEQHGSGKVLVVATDASCDPLNDSALQESQRVVLSHFDPKMSAKDRESIVQFLIEDFCPQQCYCIDSDLAWNLIASKGKPISTLTNLFALLSGFAYDDEGRPSGPAIESLSAALPHLSALYVDNARLRRILIDVLNLPSQQHQQLKVLYQPMGLTEPESEVDSVKAVHSPRQSLASIAWAGRNERKYRPSVLLGIAERFYASDFHVFGLGDSNDPDSANATMPPNVIRHRSYGEWLQAVRRGVEAFVYPAAWDGLPSVLVDVVQLGIPVVASDPSGISELIDESTGWPVEEFNQVEGFVGAIEELLSNSEEAKRRAASAKNRLEARHRLDQYRQQLIKDMIHGRPQLEVPSKVETLS